jgi:glutamate formiminotransferase
MDEVLECVVNISEGVSTARIGELAAACGDDLLDLHHDAHHHRSVFTLFGTEAPRALARAAVGLLDLRVHEGVHPRLGVVDVVPFVPLGGAPLAEAVAARDDFARWAADELQLPCFLYGPERTLPDIRRHAWRALAPDHGPSSPHPTAGAACVGARGPLVAFNVWLPVPAVDRAMAVAREVRGPHLRALGLLVGSRAQVSMNLVQPDAVGPAQAYDLVSSRTEVDGAELVGLLPAACLHVIDRSRWAELDLAEDKTIEVRLAVREAKLRR